MAKTGRWLQTELDEVENMTDNILTIMFDNSQRNADEKIRPEYYLKTLYNLIAELKVYLASHGDHPDDWKPNLNHLKDDR